MEQDQSVKYEIAFDMKQFEDFAGNLHTQKLYEIKGYINEGYFGKIFRGVNLEDGQERALKVIEIDRQFRIQQMIIENEKRVLSKVKGIPSIVECYNISQIQYSNREYLILELELCECDLLQIIKSKAKERSSFSQEFKCKVVINILDSLNYLHQNHIIHSDLKAANILIQADSAKLTDFGFSLLNSSQFQDCYGGQPTLCSPEKSSYFSYETDIFSLGLILLMLENTHFDYESNPKLDIYWLQLRKGIIPDNLGFDESSFFTSLAKQMISPNAWERGSAKSLLKKVKQYEMSIKQDGLTNAISLSADLYKQILFTNESTKYQSSQSTILPKSCHSPQSYQSGQQCKLDQLDKPDKYNVLDLSHQDYPLVYINNLQYSNKEQIDKKDVFIDLIKISNNQLINYQQFFQQTLPIPLRDFLINFHNNNISDDFLKPIISLSQRFPNLRQLEIYNEGNRDWSDKSIFELFSSIQDYQNLEKLCLFLPQNNNIQKKSLCVLSESIGQQRRIKILKLDFLYNTHLDDDFLLQLGQSISHLHSPKLIYLSFTAHHSFSHHALKLFQNSIILHQNTLDRFIFSHNSTWATIQDLI